MKSIDICSLAVLLPSLVLVAPQKSEHVTVRNSPTTLRSEAAAKGIVWEIYPPQGALPKTLTELVENSDLIIQGRVVDEHTRLSPDETSVLTDYKVEVLRVYRGENRSLKAGSTLTVIKPGGNLAIDGHPVRLDTPGFPPLPWIAPQVFFLVADRQAPAGFFRIESLQAGVYRIEEGRLLCPVPQQSLKPLCGMSESEFDVMLGSETGSQPKR